MSIYLDNSATTPIDPGVLDAMNPYLTEFYGNPSSTHAHGRAAKSAIENSRKKIADLLNASPSEIYFTSGGTESDNMAIVGLINAFNIDHVITSPLEHHAVLHTIGELKNKELVDVHLLEPDEQGIFSLEELEQQLKDHPNSLVSLMHANNEIGNLLDLESIGQLCDEYDSFFHSDTVQSIGRYSLNLGKIPVHAVLGSAHKFHGPKGIGFLYLRSDSRIKPVSFGGGQERDLRPGTENVASIVGMAKALELALTDLEAKQDHIRQLKAKMIKGLKEKLPDIAFNGLSEDLEKSLYSLVNISLPPTSKNEMILFQLDLKGISASGGSACGSGALKGSHVINAIRKGEESTNIRFSFSKYNTLDEVDYALAALEEIMG